MAIDIERQFRGFIKHQLGEEQLCEPAIDIYETKDSLMIEVELPGVQKEDIEIYTIRDRLYIKARRVIDSYEEGGGRKAYHCLERECGKFYREIELVVPCKTSQGKAKLENGILILEFPKIEDRRGQRRNLKIE